MTAALHNEHATAENRLWLDALAGFNAGDIALAERLCRSLLGARPFHSQGNLLLATIQGGKDKVRSATAYTMNAAANMGRQSFDYIAKVSLCLIRIGECEAAYRLIRAMPPDIVRPASVLIDLSQQLSALERHEEALLYVDGALASGRDDPTARYLRGNYLKFLGRLDAAAAEYEHAIGLKGDYAEAHWAMAHLGLRDGFRHRIDRLQRLADPSGHRDNAPYLWYALYKELEGAGDTEAAWAALQEGAATKRRQTRYEGAEESTLFERLASLCDSEFVDVGDRAGVSPVPVFIVGLPRTGTTLLERILGGHPSFRLCGELPDFRLQYMWTADHYCADALDAIGLDRSTGLDFPLLGRRYLEHIAWRAPDARFVTDKNPANFVLTGFILRALPAAKVLHVQRNAMDSCFSNYKELFSGNSYPYSYAVADLARHYRNYAALTAHWRSIAPHRVLDVRYEDLVSAPEATTKSIMSFLGLDYVPEQLRIEDRSFPVSTASSVQVRQPIHSKGIDGWKRYERYLLPLRRLLEEG